MLVPAHNDQVLVLVLVQTHPAAAAVVTMLITKACCVVLHC